MATLSPSYDPKGGSRGAPSGPKALGSPVTVIDAIHGRRAVREYTDHPIDDRIIARLIDAAVQAPNAMNRQAWSFVVVTDRAALERIASNANAHMLASLDQVQTPGVFREPLSRPDFDIFYGAPTLVVICTTAPDGFARHDCCLAAENLMLAAYAEGLGSCWIGFAEGWLAQPQARSELGLSEQVRPVAPIILGHPRRWPPPPGRSPPQVRWIRG